MKPKTSRSGDSSQPKARVSDKPTSPWTDALHSAWALRGKSQQADGGDRSVNAAARDALSDTYNG